MQADMKHMPAGRSLRAVALATGLLLLVPAIAMQFTDEVAWGPGDFVVAAVLLFAAGAAIVLARRRIARPAPRMAAVAAIALGAAVVGAELAVGLFR